MRLSAFDTYCLYLALKNHFTQKGYDFFKYNGKVTASKDSFMARKDRLHLQRLSRTYSADEMKDFFVANFIKGRTWSVDLLLEEADDTYREYLKRKQSLSYTFANELDNLFSEHKPNTVFKANSGVPPILNFVLSERMSPESFTILDRYTGFSKVLNERLADDFLWQKFNTLPQKLHPFLDYDREKMKTILKEKLHEYGVTSHQKS